MSSLFGLKLMHQLQDPQELDLKIFTPVNCSRMRQLKQISGCCKPERELSVEIDDVSPFGGFSNAAGRFDIRNPYFLGPGFHTIKVSYQDEGEVGEKHTVWVYIDP